jgi:hypothetical protein
MVGLALAKSLYAIPTWTKTVALVADHWKLQRVLGCEGNPPSVYAAYRFAEKLRDNGDTLARCIDELGGVHAQGRRLLRLPAPCGSLHRDGPSGGVVSRDGTGP